MSSSQPPQPRKPTLQDILKGIDIAYFVLEQIGTEMELYQFHQASHKLNHQTNVQYHLLEGFKKLKKTRGPHISHRIRAMIKFIFDGSDKVRHPNERDRQLSLRQLDYCSLVLCAFAYTPEEMITMVNGCFNFLLKNVAIFIQVRGMSPHLCDVKFSAAVNRCAENIMTDDRPRLLEIVNACKQTGLMKLYSLIEKPNVPPPAQPSIDQTPNAPVPAEHPMSQTSNVPVSVESSMGQTSNLPVPAEPVMGQNLDVSMTADTFMGQTSNTQVPDAFIGQSLDVSMTAEDFMGQTSNVQVPAASMGQASNALVPDAFMGQNLDVSITSDTFMGQNSNALISVESFMSQTSNVPVPFMGQDLGVQMTAENLPNVTEPRRNKKMCYFKCVEKPSDKAGRTKLDIKGLLRGKSSRSERPRSYPVLCLPCRTAANRLGRIFDPLPRPIPWKEPSIRSNRSALREINRCIRGVPTESEDELDMLVNRVYSMLRLEKNPVLEYLEQKGSDFSRLPPDVRMVFEETVWAEVRWLLQIGVAS
ncbi:hypothetical protein F4680DRAFT_453122 [Xylaria scruposa]|nr:hypothetical protein F4680DRAFT_453122 [Xylaria scruposa]